MRQREVRRTNMVTLQLRQLHVPPGQRLLIEDVTWADFEAIVEELGEHRGTRVAYSQGVGPGHMKVDTFGKRYLHTFIWL
jgi:hypothetical protein